MGRSSLWSCVSLSRGCCSFLFNFNFFLLACNFSLFSLIFMCQKGIVHDKHISYNFYYSLFIHILLGVHLTIGVCARVVLIYLFLIICFPHHLYCYYELCFSDTSLYMLYSIRVIRFQTFSHSIDYYHCIHAFMPQQLSTCLPARYGYHSHCSTKILCILYFGYIFDYIFV